jgi:hypothetical protein
LSGFAVLMRRTATDPWRCLNLARAEATTGSEATVRTAASTPSADDEIVLSPVPLVDRDRVRQALVTLNNQPLVARSPAERLGGDWGGVPAQGLTGPAKSVIALRNAARGAVPGSQAEWARIPTLVFGEHPQVAICAVGNGGVLPAEIARPEDPTQLRPFGLTDALPHQREVDYRRLVPVGAIRIDRPALEDDRVLPALPLPVIPDGVRPRARDLAQHSAAPTADGSPAPGGDARPPLVLLVPEDPAIWKSKHPSTYTFGIRPPAVELNTWDRWVASNPGALAVRRMVWSNVSRLQVDSAERADDDKSAQIDYTLDDPALLAEGAIEIFAIDGSGMRRRVPGGGLATGSFTWKNAVPANGAAASLGELRAAPCPVTLKAGNATGIKRSGADVEIDFGPGVWEVRFSGKLEASAAQARFGRGFRPAAESPQSNALTDDVPAWRPHPTANGELLVAPLRFIVEVPDHAMPSPQQLRGALHFSSPDQHRLKIELQTGSAPFRHVVTAQLLRQTWRWDGRPDAGLPNLDPATLDTDPKIRDWEVAEFGERPDSDHVRLAMRFIGGEPAGPLFAFEENLESDLRTQYYRLAVEVSSRYAPLLTNGGVVSSWREREDPWTHWVRHVVRCRRTEPLPKPAVRGILPLTELADGGDASVPGALVILDEAWYKQAGLGEYLHADVTSTSLHELDNVTTTTLPDVGPDPIVTARRAPAAVASPRLDVVGPVGHTFDVNTRAPLFVASSHVIRPQWTLEGTEQDFRWYFARVRFCRRLHASWNTFKLPDSEWTQPYWVQFLPDSSQYDFPAGTPYEDLHVVWDGGKPHIRRGTDSADLALKPMPSDEAPLQAAEFRLYLALTKRVVDAGGRRDQERYLGLFEQATDGAWRPLNADLGASVAATDPLVARIVEVQARRSWLGAKTEGAFWEALFPEQAEDGSTPDAVGRIVRVSRPIGGIDGVAQLRVHTPPRCSPDECGPQR